MEEGWAGTSATGSWDGRASELHEAGDVHPTNRLLRNGVDPISLMHIIFRCEALAVGPLVCGSLEKLGRDFCVGGLCSPIRVSVWRSVAVGCRGYLGNNVDRGRSTLRGWRLCFVSEFKTPTGIMGIQLSSTTRR